MIHQMGLYKEYFSAVRTGRKKVEVRLYDEKRRNVKVGDTIEFIQVPQADEKLKVKVTDLKVFETFEQMYTEIPFADFDCEQWTMQEMIEGTYELYTPAQEKEWGVLAITIACGKE